MTDHDPNIDKVLDIIEHPDRYSKEQLCQLLSDPEVREIYELLCMTDSSIEASELKTDVEAEWEAFSRNHPVRRSRIFPWLGTRAASIVAIAATSIVAVAAGIAVTLAVSYHKSAHVSQKEPIASDIAGKAIPDRQSEVKDTLLTAVVPIMFEDEPLESIMKAIEAAYGVDARFNDKEKANLHLHYRLNPELTLEQVVSQLNTFEQININLNGNQLTID